MKKLLILLLSATMILCFAGCGDSGSSGDATAEDTAAAETNAGIRGIEFAIPDGWELTDEPNEQYVEYKCPDSDIVIGVSITDDAFLEEMGDFTDAKTVSEYFEKNWFLTDEQLKENNCESEETEVLGNKAIHLQSKAGDKGYIDVSTAWLMDDVIYDVFISVLDAYDDDGNLKEDAPVLTDDDIATFDSVMSSVKVTESK